MARTIDKRIDFNSPISNRFSKLGNLNFSSTNRVISKRVERDEDQKRASFSIAGGTVQHDKYEPVYFVSGQTVKILKGHKK